MRRTHPLLKRILPALLLLVAASVCAFSQQTPVFRSGVQLVEIPVVVHDKQGKPVFHLAASDFTLLVDGKPRPVELYAVPLTAEEVANAAKRLPDGVYSNAPELNRNARGIIVVLIDSLNTCVGDQAQAKLQVIRFLRTIPPFQRLALYSVGRSFRVIHDFTSNPEVLIERLEGMGTLSADLGPMVIQDEGAFTGPSTTGTFGFSATNSDITDHRDDSDDPNAETVAEAQEWVKRADALGNQLNYGVRIRNSIRTIKAIAETLRPLSGKKTLLWLSGGFPQVIGFDLSSGAGAGQDPGFPQFDVTREFADMMKSVTQSGLTIYTVDSRGLVAPNNVSANNCDGLDAASIVKTYGTLLEAAEKTGGQSFRNTNDLAGSLRRSFDDINATYSLGFYVPEERRDGKEHRVELRLRQPGYEISYRRAYSLPKPGAGEPKEKPGEGDPLLKTAAAPIDAVGVQFLALLSPASSPEGKRSLRLIIPESQLHFAESGGKSTVTLRLMVLPINAEGGNFEGNSDTFRIPLNAAQRKQVHEKGLILDKSYAIPPEATEIRVVLQDQTRGALGSLSIPTKR